MTTRKILCVENQPNARDILTRMLEGLGYSVVLVGTAKQALDRLAFSDIDGVLLEYDLPDQTGARLHADIKSLWPHLPVLMFAGVGPQTPFMLRFFDAYLRTAELPSRNPLQDLVG